MENVLQGTTGNNVLKGVAVAMHELEGNGLIRSARNRVRLLDRAGLERTANGFYGAPEDEYRRLFAEEVMGREAA